MNLEIEVEDDDYVVELDDRFMMLQKIYCNNIEKLIQMDFEYKNINYFRERYVEKLIEMGISDNRMKLNQEDILKAFKGFYGEEYLNALGINFYIKNQYNWVTKICRKHRNLFHPMQHLLMIQFLNIDIEELFKKDNVKTDNKDRLQKKNINEIKEHRKLWLTLKDEHNDLTVSELRKYDYSTYRWLLKYDKGWILKNSPKRKSKGNNHKIDWKERDREILALCKNAVSEILKSDEKPQRVSKALIGRMIGKQYLIAKYLDRLAETEKFLDDNVESVEQFQERRITWVQNKYPDMSKWEKRRIIGIR
ncbi:TnsD family Tn7-like transposition protein [Clostridium sp. VAP23]|uniref:TnsD family Tn7-like transposition protein n=1 Tax=Clostridium sp. VAP23 TaxID=2949981 RepID=UPI00207AEB17|nr:TnsD family Tn7-like transposition protein [Clostridium sp. VAP23]